MRTLTSSDGQPVGGDLDEFGNTETHGIAEKLERDGHSIFLRG